MPNILIVDDEQSICWALAELARQMGHAARAVSSSEAALRELAAFPPDVILLDVRLPGEDGLSAMPRIRERLGAVPIIIMTAYGDLGTAVEAVQGGVFDYVVKPFELDDIEALINRALLAPGPPPTRQADGQSPGLVGRSPIMQRVFRRIALAANSTASVMLCGESGTGKELAARAIHRFSFCKDGPFVAANVASLSPSLAESELFGHAKGAFTGAEAARTGLLARAHQGTLFLDEVGDIPPAMQIKLLRAIEEQQVTPVGAANPAPAHFRVISATHRNLLAQVQSGEFRHDLYFRLCGVQIDLPPLRERGEDIELLAEHFIARAASKSDHDAPRLTEPARRELYRRAWHGNVRELRNTIDHAVALARQWAIAPEHLPAAVSIESSAARDDAVLGGPAEIARLIAAWAQNRLAADPQPEHLYEDLLALVEPPLLIETLRQAKGQHVTAARLTGLHRTTVKKKLTQYGIEGVDG